MKFNLEIELDYIDEEGNLDEEIKRAIIHNIAQSIIGRYSVGDIKDLVAVATEQLKAKSEEKIKELFDDFMEKPIEIRKGWSHSEKYKNATEFLEQTLEAAVNVHTSPSNGADCQFYHYLKERVESETKKYINSLKEELDKKAKIVAKEIVEQNSTIAALKTLLDAADK